VLARGITFFQKRLPSFVKAKFHYASWFGAGSEPVRSWFKAAGSKLVQSRKRNGIWLLSMYGPSFFFLQLSVLPVCKLIIYWASVRGGQYCTSVFVYCLLVLMTNKLTD